MQQRLKDRNLDHIPTQRLTSPAEACRHAAELLKQYPRLVLKPADSAGTDSVFVCTTPEEVKVRVTCLFENNNQLNLKNEIIILQPFNEGEEMVVDTVSYGGHHKICAIWKMGKGRYNGFDSICEFTELTALDTAQPVRLQDYVFGCLDALEIA